MENTKESGKNFIRDLDDQARKTTMQYIFKKVIFDAGGRHNENFLFRKETRARKRDIGKTRILYIKDHVRVRFTDNDILDMILRIEKKEVVCQLLKNLKAIYVGKYTKTVMVMGQDKYEIPLLPAIEYDQLLDNRKDICIAFEDLYVLINLIIAKDIAANDTVDAIDFFERTLYKYILVIGYYYFHGAKEKTLFDRMKIESTGDFYFDFEVGGYAKENLQKITNYKQFDFSEIL
ncbi:MAG: hypothetical protein NC417_05635 [Candidatus Gastranaerophilales bacterium]|nr:hypothetical protein [Candidatus Gastranaerophilales bacterium]